MQCNDGDVRLLQGKAAGQVEVCVGKRWASVCYNGWSDDGANVTCRQLGYANGKRYALHHIEIYIPA